MAKSHKKSPQRSLAEELVTVAFAEDMDQAREYRQLLKENDIPATIKNTARTPNDSCFAVMVPEDCLDEAHVIIESKDAYRDFCDYAFEDDGDEFADDRFEDEEF